MAIVLSKYTNALLETLHKAHAASPATDTTHLQVSQTVSFFALAYEKVRNSIEFREEHLVRRAAIERILRRRLAINPGGKGEGENVVRELLWARYISPEMLKNTQIHTTQKGIDMFNWFSSAVAKTHGKITSKQSQYLYDILSCEIEEHLEPHKTKHLNANLYFYYQVMHKKFQLAGVEDAKRDAYFYTAAEVAFAKNDNAYTRYHLFTLHYGLFTHVANEKLSELVSSWPTIVADFEKIIENPYKEKLIKHAKRQVAPFLILNDIIKTTQVGPAELLQNEEQLLEKVQASCEKKYIETSTKLRTAMIRSISYIFLTKMIFVLLLEIPLSRFFYGGIEALPLIMNVVMPPLFMGLLVSFFRAPDAKNTQRIYNRIVNIINTDETFETAPIKLSKETQTKRPLLVLGFTLMYFVFFGTLFGTMFVLLDKIGFSIVGTTIFLFFLTVVGFFGYRIRQTAKEYSLEESEGVLSPILYFIFLPIVSVGKFLSNEVARFNVLILVFDVLIEAPFKMIIDIIEEWVKFVRGKREEI